MSEKKYKIITGERLPEEEETNIWAAITQLGILAIICIMSFLVAKYIVRNDIIDEESPIDTSERL